MFLQMSIKFLSQFKNTNWLIYDDLDAKSLYNLVATCKGHGGVSEDYFKKRIREMYGEMIVEKKRENMKFRQQYHDIVQVLEYGGLKEQDEKNCRLDILMVVREKYGYRMHNFYYSLEIIDLETFKYLIQDPRNEIYNWMSARAVNNWDVYEYLLDKCQLKPPVLPDVFCGKDYVNQLDAIVKKYRFKVDASCFEGAIKANSVETIKWLMQHLELSDYYLNRCCEYGHEDVYDFFLKIGWKPNVNHLNSCIGYGHLKLAQKIIDQFKLSPMEYAVEYAYIYKSLSALKWLWKNYKLHPRKFHYSCNLDILIWSTQFKLAPDQRTVNRATGGGDLKVVRWCVETYKLFPEKNWIMTCTRRGDKNKFETIQYLFSVRQDALTEKDIQEEHDYSKCYDFGYLPLCKFFFTKFNLVPDFKSLSLLLTNGKFHILHWFQQEFTTIYQSWLTTLTPPISQKTPKL